MIPAGILSSDSLTQITAAENSAITRITNEKTSAINAVELKGQTTLASIPADYTSLSNEVDEVKESITNLEDIIIESTEIEPDSERTGAYYWPNKAISAASDTVLKRVNIVEGTIYAVTTSFTGSTGFPLIVYFDSEDTPLSYEYMNEASVEISITKQELTIPATAAWFYVNSRYTTSHIYTIEKINDRLENDETVIASNTSRIEANEEDIENIKDEWEYWKEKSSDYTRTGAYYWPSKAISAASDTELKRINIVAGETYAVTTSFTGSTGFPLIVYFDSENTPLSYEYMNETGVETSIEKQQLNIPATAAWFYVNSRYTEAHIYTLSTTNLTIPEIADKLASVREVSILFVGNSLTQDGLAYLPYLLTNFYPEINFHFFMWYNGGYTLAQQYAKFTNNQNCEIFSVAENTGSWTNGTAKMADILASRKIDIVCLQEYFTYKESYTESDLSDWNNCRDYITSHYTGGNGLEFISLIHAPHRTSADPALDVDECFSDLMAGNALILQKTIAEDAIPNGIAVYRALSTALDSLGDQGHLSPDGTHTQEGLPCLLQTYTTLLWLFDKVAINKSVYGIPFKMTTEIYNTINVPGPNLGTGVIEGTDAQNLLAQEVAIKAYKEGKQFVIENLYSGT